MATQAKQVFYILDPVNDKWSIILSVLERKFSEKEDYDENYDLYHDCFIVGQPIHEQVENIQDNDNDSDSDTDDRDYLRNDIEEGIWVECESTKNKIKKKKKTCS